VFAWTGEGSPSLRVAFLLVCAAGLFQSFSTLGLVLYRASGRVLFDNIRLASQIVILFSIALFGRRLGFYGVLAGLAVTELLGMVFMLFGLTKAFEVFRIRVLLPDALRLTAAIAIVLFAGGIALLLPLPVVPNARLAATLELAKVSFACLIAAWPALALTKSLTPPESQAIVAAFLFRRGRSARPAGQAAS
jgi:hypothetical protein